MRCEFAEFSADRRAEGFDEVVEVTWPPLTVIDTHHHAFEANALLVRGEMWLTIGDNTRHLHPGSTFLLEPGELHSERYGTDGATYWVGRRKAP
jgi:quercetin dioxygenase-like cupin family protein